MDLLTKRFVISPEQARDLREANLLVEESHRVRPRYFDGKFLAARDLTRDQAYVLARQAAYARALGPGVVEGLQVRAGAVASDLEVDGGFGYTPAGELVSLRGGVRVSLAQLFRLQTLAVQLQQLKLPRPPLRNRTGLFVLGLRALEFEANPVAAYPTRLDGPRQVEEGDIVEASALTLSFVSDAAPERMDRLRGELARDAFVARQLPPLPAEVLPLALVAIAGDMVRWVDTHLVRRVAGQAQADTLGFGFAPRLLREAHLAQYRAQLAELGQRGLPARPSAASWFGALPAAGPMPASAVNPADFSQSWFPPGIDAELALVPEDEIAALVEESLVLPPLDLTLPPEALAASPVAILLPVARESLARAAQRLEQRFERTLVSPAPRLGAKLPLAAIRDLAATRLTLPPLTLPPRTVDGIDAVWAELLAARSELWFMRRRQLALRPQIEGTPVAIVAPAHRLRDLLNLRLVGDLGTRANAVLENADVGARADLSRLLASERFASPLLASAAIASLEGRREVSEADVAAVAERLAAPGVGEGLARLEAERPDLVADETALRRLASSDRLLELDRALATSDRFEATRVATELRVPSRGAINFDRVLNPR